MSEVTKQKVDFIFRIIEVAEMKQVDFSYITGISRETIHRWKKGHNVADQLRLTRAYWYAQMIQKGCKAGRFPLPEKLKTAERQALLKKIVAEMSRPQ